MKICFWGDSAGAFKGNPRGGGELQIALMSKALVRAGHEVVYIDYRIEKSFVTEEGVKVFNIEGYNRGIPVLRTLTHRLRLIYKTLKNQKADVYYCRIRDFRHFLAYKAARKVRARFVLGLASDIDVEGLTKRLKYLYFAEVGGLWWFFNAMLSELAYFWLLRNADLVLVQHAGQKEKLLKKRIGSTVFNNLIDLAGIPRNCNTPGEDFCYVGSIDKRKGFIDFYELMRNSSSFGFRIIGSPRDKTGDIYYRKCQELSNAKLLGRLSHIETLRQMSGSKALISTSPMEGFPNIFLEAWACGVPVMSLHFDPGNIIVKENLGFVAGGNFDDMLTAMKELRFPADFASRSKAYVERNHSLNEDKIREISDVFSGAGNMN